MIEALEIRRLLTTYTVDLLADQVDSNRTPGNLSLREAIIEANSNPGADEIVLPAGTLNLTIAGANEDGGLTGDLDITDSVTIVGDGTLYSDPSMNTIIDAHQIDRVFDITSLGSTFPTVTISGVQIQNGLAVGGFSTGSGGGIRAKFAVVNLIDDVITNNAAGSSTSDNFGGYGGGIDIEGATTQQANLSLIRTTVTKNSSGSGVVVGGAGGGIAVNNTTTIINDSTISSNHTGDGESGDNLTTAGDGGGIDSSLGSLTIIDSQIRSNVVGNTTLGHGGGIAFVSGSTTTDYPLMIEKSNISGNQAYIGGGINVNSGSSADSYIIDSSIFSNRATGEGGGLAINAADMGLIQGCSFYANTAVDGATSSGGAGIFNFGTIGEIVNSTIYGNTAAGPGGGIHNNGQINQIVNVTIDGNKASAGGGLYSESFATIGELSNTIIANNLLSDGITAQDLTQIGTLTTAHNNLIESPNGHSITGGVDGNIVGTDPMLESFRRNGNLTSTLAPASGSPVIDAGESNDLTTDQRGSIRPANGAVDIGAVELRTDGNALPVAVNKVITSYEDIPVEATLDYFDVDTSDYVPITLVDPPDHGQFFAFAPRLFAYLPDKDFNGTDSFTYTITDASGISNVGTVTINVLPVTDALTPNPQTQETEEDTPLNGQLTATAEGPGGTVSYALVGGPSHGTTVVNPDGTYTYTPAKDFNGADAFTFSATRQDGRTGTAVVSITVLPVNDAPVSADDQYSVDAGSTLIITSTPVSKLTMVSDAGDYIGQGLTYDLASPDSTFDAQSNFDNGASFTVSGAGGVHLDFAAPNNALLTPGQYDNAMRFPFQTNGRPGLDVSMSSRDSNTLTGQFTVYDIVWNADHSDVLSFAGSFDQYSDGDTAGLHGMVRYNSAVGTGAGVLANDSDAEGDWMTAALVGGPAHGTLSLNADGTFSYTPNDGFTGVDTFTYRASDGQLWGNLATVTITVNPATSASNQYVLVRNAADSSLLDIRLNGVLSQSIPFDQAQAVTLNGTGGDDSLTLDYSNGEVMLPAGINFDGGAGIDTLRVIGASGDEPFHAGNGAVTHGTGTLTQSLDVFDLESGSFDFDAGVGPVELDVAAAQIRIHAAQHFSALNLSAGANVSLEAGKNLLVSATGLSIDNSSTLDLADNDFLLDYTADSPLGTWTGGSYTDTTGLIQSKRIMSSLDSHDTSLSIAEASGVLGISGTQTSTWDGQTVDSTALLIKYTYAGDANLDGKINIDDYGRIDSHVGQSGVVFGWYNGDFNYDGKINIDDYGLIDSVIGAQGPVL